MKKFNFLRCFSLLFMQLLFCTVFAQGVDDFNTLTSSNPTSYQSRMSTNGWSVTNARLETTIFDCDRKMVVINGKTTAVGVIQSPILQGGCGNLTFNFANTFAENNGAEFKVELLRDATVLYDTIVSVANADMPKETPKTFTANPNVSGSFVLKITNLSPSNASSNKDRLAVGCIEWTGYGQGTEVPVVAAPTFTPAAGEYLNSVTVTLAAAEGMAIRYTTDGSNPAENGVAYTEPIELTTTTTLKAIAVSGDIESAVVSATYEILNPIVFTSIADFKANAVTNTLYHINTDLTFVYRDGRYMFVQDETGGLLIYDNSNPIITTEYEEGDVIPNGVIGKLTVYSGLTEIVPEFNMAEATSNVGAIAPMVVTAEQIIDNYALYESKLVRIENVIFNAEHQFSTSRSTSAAFQQNGNTMSIYNRFRTLDLAIEEGDFGDVVGFASIYNNQYQLFARTNEDVNLAIYSNNIDFDGNLAWRINNEFGTNGWYVGQAQGFDNNKLYISSTQGATNKYANVASQATCDVLVSIPENGAVISFDARINGENGADYVVVKVGQTVMTALQGLNDWENVSINVPASFAGNQTLSFIWVNDGENANQYPAAIDNIVVTEMNCAMPTDIAATVNEGTATITWNANGLAAWNFQYRLTGAEDWYSLTSSTNSVTLNNLQSNSAYEVRVQSVCEEGNSVWCYGNFTIPCLSFVAFNDEETIGNGSSTQSYFLGGYYGFQYSANIYENSKYGPLQSISVFSTSSPSSGGNITVWVKQVPADFTMSSSNTFAQLKEGAVEVYNGMPTITSGAWIEFPVNGAVVLTEGYKLLVLTKAIGCSTSGSCTRNVRYTSVSNAVWHKRQDGSDPGENVTGSMASSLANMKLVIAGSVCEEVVNCPAPTNVLVNNITTNAAQISWTMGAEESAWLVKYRQEGTSTWTMVTASESSLTLSSLLPITNYEVCVKALCGEQNESVWSAIANFTTLSECATPENLSVNILGSSAIITWDAVEATTWEVSVKETHATQWMSINTTTSSYTISGLMNSTAYDVKVKAICEETYSADAVAQFTTGCPIMPLAFSETFGYQLPNCWSNEGFTFNGSANSANIGQYLMTPLVEAPIAPVLYVVFDVKAGANQMEDYQVLVSSNGNAIENFYTIYEGTISGSTYETVTLEIPTHFLGNAIQVMFKHTEGNGTLTIDNVVISNCINTPSNLEYTNVTETSVDLTWTAEAGTSWLVEYSADNGTTWNSVVVNSANYTLANLLDATDYMVRVRTICGENSYSAAVDAVSFTTLSSACGVRSLPFTEDFETAWEYEDAQSDAVAPLCWVNINRGDDGRSTYFWTRETSASNSHSGSGSAKCYTDFGTEDHNDWLITPRLALTGHDLLTFWARRYSSATNEPDEISIYVSNANATIDASSMGQFDVLPGFTRVINIQIPQGDWAKYEVDLTGYEGVRYVAFVREGTPDGWTLRLDDITIEATSSCVTPTNLAVSNVTTNGATLSWTANASETQWNVKYGPIGFNPETEGTLVTVTENPFVLTGLEPASEYEVSVQAVCSELSRWSENVLVATLCAPKSLPFVEGFENCTTGQASAPICWTFLNRVTSGYSYPQAYVNNSSSYVHSGSKSLYFKSSSTTPVYAVLPEIAASLSNLQISFWYRNEGTTASNGTLELGVMSDPTDASTFTMLYSCPKITTLTEVTYSFATSGFTNGHIAFRYVGGTYNNYYLGVDDIMISELPSCPAPSALVASNITTNEATISWTEEGTSTSWNVQYGPAGFELGTGTSITVDANSIVLSGLEPTFNYDVYVQAICPNGSLGGWSNSLSFATNCGLANLPYRQNFEMCEVGYNAPEPLCWTILNNNTTNSYSYPQAYVNTSSSYVNSGSQSLYMKSSAETPIYAALPKINANIDEVALSFWYRNGGVGSTDGILSVGVMTDPEDASTFQEVLVCERINVLTQKVVDFSNFDLSGTNYHIAFKYMGVANNYYLGIDDIEVYRSVFDRDLAVEGMQTINSACDLNNMAITAKVVNAGLVAPANNFTISYAVNGGTPVVENVALENALNPGEVYVHTFQTNVSLVNPTNVISIQVQFEGDMSNVNDTYVSETIYHLDPIAIDGNYVEAFDGALPLGWNSLDLNQDNVTFAYQNNAIQYAYNDEVNANDWIFSPCYELEAGKYLVSFDYNALSVMQESFNFYYGTAAHVSAMDMVSMYQFNGTEVERATQVITIEEAGVYYFAFESTSQLGNIGFAIDNFAIDPIRNVTYSVVGQGVITPMGVEVTNNSFDVTYGASVPFIITPTTGNRVASIVVNGVQVAAEDAQNAATYLYTLDNITENQQIVVTFATSQYIVAGYVTVEDLTEAAILTPASAVVAYGEAHAITIQVEDYYHVASFTIDNEDAMEGLVRNGNTYTYEFDAVTANHMAHATIEKDTFAIVYHVSGGYATIDGQAVVNNPDTIYTWIKAGDDLLSSIVAAPGYQIENIVVNGTYLGAIDAYQFNDIYENQTVVVELAEKQISINTTAYGLGSISEGETFVYDPTHSYILNATPNQGNTIASLTINGAEVVVTDPTNSYVDTLRNITDDLNIVAYFEPQTFTISATAQQGGIITPMGVSRVNYNADVEYSITPANGYVIADVLVDGVSQGAVSTYRFTQVRANHTIEAQFEQVYFTITVDAGSNGTITPGTTTIASGASQVFSIQPNVGYAIENVMVDGINMGVINSYTFTNVEANHTIEATFIAVEYTIHASVSGNGTITPVGASTITYGASQTYSIAANTGYHIADVLVDGVSVGAVNSYTFENVNANHTIVAEMAINTYSVTVNTPINGSITPSGTQNVNYGATPTFHVVPNAGYSIATITLNGVAMNFTTNASGVAVVTLPAVVANVTLTATMTPNTYTIAATAGANGSITPAGNSTVSYGENKTYTITPNVGYSIQNVVVDGISMGVINSFTFTNVMENHTISATFMVTTCETPMNTYITDLDETTVTLNWNNTGASSYTVHYKELTAPNYTEIPNITATQYSLSGLEKGTTYIWSVKANCGTNHSSEWAGHTTFKTRDYTIIVDTTIIGITENEFAAIQVYGYNQNVYIVNNDNVNISQVAIFDAYGKVIYRGDVTESRSVISLNVATGIYVVRIESDNKAATYKVHLTK